MKRPSTRLSTATDVSSPSARGEAAAAIVHDVKQPLSAIAAEAAACCNWLAKAPPDPAQIVASLNAIVEDVQRASALIERLQAQLLPAPQSATCEVDRDLESV